ncbi:MAG: hypothetical protein ACOYLF_02900 [Blastocatellia bacterium]
MTIGIPGKKISGVILLLVALALTGLAQGDFKGKGDGIETCPVTGEKITSKDVSGEFFGRTVYFCCGGCLDSAKKSPDLYVKKTEKEQLEAVKALGKPAGGHGDHAHAAPMADGKFLGKGDGVETCPVTGEKLTSRNIKGEFFGRTVYFCCEGCLATAGKNPDLYIRKEAPKSGSTAFLGRGDGVETCPVTGEPVDKKAKGEINGRTVYVCCPGCLDTIRSNPSAYLK